MNFKFNVFIKLWTLSIKGEDSCISVPLFIKYTSISRVSDVELKELNDFDASECY